MIESAEALAVLLRTSELVESSGRRSYADGDYVSATQLLASAVAQAPDRADLRLLLNRSIKKQIPRWHFRMMNDTIRNEAYQAAIEATVSPGAVVLDIGTGAGITAMMSARAGAGHVYSCESDPLLATLAREVIANNGLSNRVTVLNCHSQDIVVGDQMPDPANVLLTEIFDCGLLGESALVSIADASSRLMAGDGVLVPESGSVYGQLVESQSLHELNHVHEVAGFDVSVFNLVESCEYFRSDLHWYPHQLLSKPFRMFDFCFGAPSASDRVELQVPVVRTGRCHAIAFWFVLDLAPGVSLSSDPWEPATHWRQAIQTLRTPRELRAGEVRQLVASHDTERVRISFSEMNSTRT